MRLNEFKQKTGLYLAVEQTSNDFGTHLPASAGWNNFVMLVACNHGEIMVPCDHPDLVSIDFVFERFLTMLRYFERCDFAGLRAEYSELDHDDCVTLFKRIGEHAANMRKMLGEDYLTLIDEVVL